MMKNILLILLFGLFFHDVSAIQIPKSFRMHDIDPNGNFGSGTLQLDITYGTLSDSVDDLPLTGCNSGCDYGMYMNYNSNGNKWLIINPLGKVITSPSLSTWGDLSDEFEKLNGKTGSVVNMRWNLQANAIKCVTIGVAPEKSNGLGSPTPPYIPAGTDCFKPVTINSCVVSTSNVSLEHGIMTPQEVNGHIAEDNLLVSCGSPLPVKFKLTPSGDLSIKNGEITSHLTINDTEIGEEMNLPKDRSDLKIKSKLQVEGEITAGTFSGSQTLIMTIQ